MARYKRSRVRGQKGSTGDKKKGTKGSEDSLIDLARYDGAELQEANELKWEMLLERGLGVMGKDANAILCDKKSEQWKILLATVIKRHTKCDECLDCRTIEHGDCSSCEPERREICCFWWS